MRLFALTYLILLSGCLAHVKPIDPNEPQLKATKTIDLNVTFLGNELKIDSMYVCLSSKPGEVVELECVSYTYYMERLQKTYNQSAIR